VSRPGVSLQLDDDDEFSRILNSRHGLVLFLAHKRKQVLVWDPVTGDQHIVAVPGEFYINTSRIQGRCFVLPTRSTTSRWSW
jgi:hypothetical protein